MIRDRSLRIAVAGAAGHLGRKLLPALAGAPWCADVVALDRAFPDDPPASGVRRVTVDLRRPSEALTTALAGADALVHLAAQNPYPDASWDDACASFDMTLTLAREARRAGLRRFVFASSNHVMGGYKDDDPPMPPGSLTTEHSPRPGTRIGPEPSPAYAVAKLMGERLLAGTAASDGFTAVSLRIGWCQPGDNHPRTLSAGGVPGDAGGGPNAERDLAWFRNMWLSNRDFVALVEAALTAESAGWPSPAIVVNAMSANTGMAWDLAAPRRLLGYAPRDDVWAELRSDS